MKKIAIVFFSVLFVFINCQKQEKVIDLQKVDAHQRLDQVLEDINILMETIKIDTLQLETGDMKDKLVDSIQKLVDLRNNVLKRISMIDTVSRNHWDTFKTNIDSTENHVSTELDVIRDYLTIEKKPPIRPVY